MAVDDGYAPALGESPSDTAPVAGVRDDAPDDDADDAPDDERAAAPRQIKASTAEFAKRIAAAHKAKELSDTVLQPVIGASPAAKAPPAAGAPAGAGTPAIDPAKPGAAPAAGAPAALPDDLVRKHEQANATLAQLERDRQAFDAERQRYAGLARGKLLGSPDEMHAATMALIRDELGEGATDAQVVEALTDYVTELSLKVAGVTLPDTARSKAELRRAERLIANHTRKTAKEANEAKSKAERDEQVRNRTTTADKIGKEIDAANAHPFLRATTADERDGASIGEFIVEVIDQRFRHDGTRLTWQEAATLANEHFKKAATAHSARWSPLLTPPPANGGASVAGAPQGDRSDAQVRRTLTNTDASAPEATGYTPKDGERWDADEHRRATQSKWQGKIGKRSDS